MKKDFEKVFQFRIELIGSNPPIWRQIQVPETYSFWDLHVAIQNAMGWEDCHLNEFRIKNPKNGWMDEIGIPMEDSDDDEIISEWEAHISDYFSKSNRKGLYIYDFGDEWRHLIKLEKVIAKEENVIYPVCIAGERACPPEDCGGIYGYEEILRALKNPKSKRYKEIKEWLDPDFDPEYFDIKEIKFYDPEKHRRNVLR